MGMPVGLPPTRLNGLAVFDIAKVTTCITLLATEAAVRGSRFGVSEFGGMALNVLIPNFSPTRLVLLIITPLVLMDIEHLSATRQSAKQPNRPNQAISQNQRQCRLWKTL